MQVEIKKDWKKFRSENYNYDFNLKNGFFARWGVIPDENPIFAPYGPEIADIEITTICNGVKGVLCSYCYKANTPTGENMSFDTFKKLIENINYNGQLTQVAFGLGSTGWENPDLWQMCDYLRANHIIPNGTLADVDDAMASKVSDNFGAVAISYHGDFEVLCNSVEKLTMAKKLFAHSTLKQVNIHYMIAEETLEECYQLFDYYKNDQRLKDMNSIVLLGLKKCGRADGNYFHKLTDQHFIELISYAHQNKIPIGFDSCQANKVINVYKNHIFMNDENKCKFIETIAEPCESFGLFSSYFDVYGKYHPCSFCPGSSVYNAEWTEVDGVNLNFKNVWESQTNKLNELRQRSLANNRSCLYYEV